MKILPSRRAAASMPAPEASATVAGPEMPAGSDFDGYALMRELHPAYAAMQDRFELLTAREDAILHEMAPINDRKRRDGSWDGAEASMRAYARAHPPAPPPPPRPGALALLEGAAVAPPPPLPPVSPFAVRPDDAEYTRLTAELADVQAALEILRPQLRTAHLEASRMLAEFVSPLYRGVAGRYARAVVELGEAMREHATFIHSVRNSAWAAIKPIAIAREMGEPSDPASLMCRIIGFAIETGHVSAVLIPDGWKVKRSSRPEPIVHTSKGSE